MHHIFNIMASNYVPEGNWEFAKCLKTIVIFSMQEVASCSVLMSLQAGDLNSKIINSEIEIFHGHGFPNLARYVKNANDTGTETLLIIGVREPIQHGIALFWVRNTWKFHGFQNIMVDCDTYVGEVEDIEKMDVKQLTQTIIPKGFTRTCPLFLESLKHLQLLGDYVEDVSATFDRRRGWGLYRRTSNPNLHVAFYKQEMFGRFFDEFLHPCLGATEENRVTNQAVKKPLYDMRLKSTDLLKGRIPRDSLKSLYSMSCIRCFYSDEEIEEFMEKWALMARG